MNGWLIAGALSLAMLTGSAGIWVGYDQGRAAAQAKQDHDAAQALATSLQQATDAINQANAASTGMRTALNKLQDAQGSSTKELKNALAKNHSDPVCHLDPDSMRILDQARASAAQAAAGGVLGAVPGSGGAQ